MGTQLNKQRLLFFFFFFLISRIAASSELGEYWRRRAEEAEWAAREAFHPNAEEVAEEVNSVVTRFLKEGDGTRRYLKEENGPCEAKNPIDKCWRCDPNWADNRKRLADCVIGFGRNTTGGKLGRFYVVNDSSDPDCAHPKPGTLRHAVTRKEPLWIIFSGNMFIKLNQELIMTGDKTIDGRGADVHIAFGAGFTIQFVRNVIIHGIHIHNIVGGSSGLVMDSEEHIGLRTRNDGDGISIFGSTNVWIDHVSMSRCADGLIDAIMASTAITISNSHFTDHDKAILLGASDSYSPDAIMQATVAFNRFGPGLVQRMPRCRWGFFHVVNNDYFKWFMYAIGGSEHPTILSQGNRFTAPDRQFAKEVTKREHSPESEWKNWSWRSEGDVMENGASFVESGAAADKGRFKKKEVISFRPGTYVPRLTQHSGVIPCQVGRPC